MRFRGWGALRELRWTASDGMVGLGDLPGHSFSSFALAVSADGSVVVGQARGTEGFDGWEVFMWDETHGMRSFRSVLIGLGLDLEDWILYTAKAISPDGLHIVGMGINPSGQSEAFLATVPEPATVGLVTLGLSAVLFRRRKRSRQRSA